MNEGPGLVRASEVMGLPVVTIDGGHDAAEIKDVIYDATQHQLVGFTLNKRGWFRGRMRAVLDADNVVAVGPHAVMVSDDDCLTDRRDTSEALESPKAGIDVIGNDVIASSGKVIGTVIDVIIETGERPSAVGYEVDGDNGPIFVPSSAQMSLSNDNLVVPAEAEDFAHSDLAGFGASVQSFRRLLGRGDRQAPERREPERQGDES